MTSIAVFVAACTSAQSAVPADRIQSLWSGYGEIRRMRLEGETTNPKRDTVVVKKVAPPKSMRDRSISHLRKLKSYEVETNFYENWSAQCSKECRVPGFLGAQKLDQEWWIVLEDLDKAGYPLRLHSLEEDGVGLCLRWLANFHATFLGQTPTGLWDIGTYWHLDTRPDELRAMSDADGLKKAAAAIDRRLNACRFKTLVHGDAKLANFCFSPDRRAVAAVDFQYVGGGCGMKDVCYFLGSGWGGVDDEEYARGEARYLDIYFAELHRAVKQRCLHTGVVGGGEGDGAAAAAAVDLDALEEEWRGLYPLAAADFARFMAGWSPGEACGPGTHGARLCQQALAALREDVGADRPAAGGGKPKKGDAGGGARRSREIPGRKL